ncbi:baseplate J/gp47 family protein [Lederbergia wuyishanensis]|uniref:Phage protein gp47/JayE n=1 Tax=Lederbergia wuyishanensis TaxID=1347903 RepID=A0ABU0D760_9BACI|nr:baseplate J/gp47 family protein [Lederbergia wuyishanensis]MCJ8008892.1 baseplate J/gp47 family protein [Lederbergia wuyishanensis]MDQ0344217.1 putative phage protein gp47/JayE [Lederbergia wuyishanensis]
MLFEDRTFEAIRDEMLEAVSDDVDKREGSIIYDAIAPAALKLAEMYSNLNVFLDLVFADTADGDFLERRAAELGVYKKFATPSIRKGIFKDSNGLPMDIPIGCRFSFGNLTFETIEKITSGEYKLQAETPGIIGNIGSGTILPIEPIDNLGTAEISDVLIPGTDDETDDSLYNRYKIRTQKQATSGNAYHYEQWALSVPGVGGAKVIPTWNGPNTVKVVLLSTDKKPVTPSVVDETAQYIDQERPIGAIVTVVSSTELPINVSAKLTLAAGATIEDVTNQFKASLAEYLQSIAFVTNGSTKQPELIRYTRIANLLLDVPPIIDYTNLFVNGGTANIQPTAEQVGIVGNVVFT